MQSLVATGILAGILAVFVPSCTNLSTESTPLAAVAHKPRLSKELSPMKVVRAAYSQDGTVLTLLNEDGTLDWRSAQSLRLLRRAVTDGFAEPRRSAGSRVSETNGHSEPLSSFLVADDANVIIASDSKVSVLDGHTGYCQWSFPPSDSSTEPDRIVSQVALLRSNSLAVVFDDDSLMIASRTGDGQQWYKWALDATTNNPIPVPVTEIPPEGRRCKITTVSNSASRKLALGFDSGHVVEFDPTTNSASRVRQIGKLSTSIQTLGSTANGQSIAAASANQCLMFNGVRTKILNAPNSKQGWRSITVGPDDDGLILVDNASHGWSLTSAVWSELTNSNEFILAVGIQSKGPDIITQGYQQGSWYLSSSLSGVSTNKSQFPKWSPLAIKEVKSSSRSVVILCEASNDTYGIAVVAPDGRVVVRPLPQDIRFQSKVIVSGDGTRFILRSEDGTLFVLSALSGEILTRVPAEKEALVALDFHGDVVALGSGNGEVLLTFLREKRSPVQIRPDGILQNDIANPVLAVSFASENAATRSAAVAIATRRSWTTWTMTGEECNRVDLSLSLRPPEPRRDNIGGASRAHESVPEIEVLSMAPRGDWVFVKTVNGERFLYPSSHEFPTIERPAALNSDQVTGIISLFATWFMTADDDWHHTLENSVQSAVEHKSKAVNEGAYDRTIGRLRLEENEQPTWMTASADHAPFWIAQSEMDSVLLRRADNLARWAWLYIMPDWSYVTLTFGGRFDAGDVEKVSGLSWSFADDPNRSIPIDIFVREYFEPNLLGKLAANTALRSVPSLNERTRAVPIVNSIEFDKVREDGSVNVKLDVAEGSYHFFDDSGVRRSGIEGVRLFRDGQLIGTSTLDVSATTIKVEPAHRILNFHTHVPYGSDRAVEFSAYAFNQDVVRGPTTRASLKASRNATRPAKAFILAVGISAYGGALPNLDFAASDAEKFSVNVAKAFSSSGYQTNSLLRARPSPGGSSGTANGAVSKEIIRKEFEGIAKGSLPGDAVVIFFACHGQADPQGNYELLLGKPQIGPGMKLNEQERITSQELVEWLSPIDATEIILIVDACFSESAVEAGGFRPGPFGDRGLGQLAYDKAMRILVAARENQRSIEMPSLNGGVLTHTLVDQALRNGINKEDRISVSDWIHYPLHAVPRTLRANAGTLGESPQLDRISFESAQVPVLFDFSSRRTHGGEIEFKILRP